MKNPLRRTLVGWVPLALLAAGAAAPLQAQTVEIRGHVLDAVSGQGIAGASVRARSARRTALTDSAGAFVLSGVPFGRDTLIIEHMAYQALAVEIVPSAELRLRIELTPAPIRLDSLIVLDQRDAIRALNGAASRRALDMWRGSEPPFWRSWDREAIVASGADDAFLFIRRGPPKIGIYPCATLGSPPDRLCVSTPFRGTTTRLTVHMDDRPVGGIEALRTHSMADIHRVETYGLNGESGIRLYTGQYLRLVGLGLIRP